DYANRHWHYDTRYFDTSIATMQRVVVRVWAGTTDTKSNPLAEVTGFLGTSLTPQGASNVDWTRGSTAPAPTSAKSAPGSIGALPGPATPPSGLVPPGIGPAQGIGGNTPLGGDMGGGANTGSGSTNSDSSGPGGSGTGG